MKLSRSASKVGVDFGAKFAKALPSEYIIAERRKKHKVMTMNIVVFDRYDKNRIADMVHDRFFDVENIRWDKDRQYLEIAYFKDDNCKTVEGKISFRHVVDIKLIDTEKIGYYDLNFINWDEEENKIELVTNIPLTFEITATKFEMTITMT